MSEWVKFIKRNKPIAKWPGGPRFERFMHDAPVNIGSIGVCLNDKQNPPTFYEFAGFVDTRKIELTECKTGKSRFVSLELFWPLT